MAPIIPRYRVGGSVCEGVEQLRERGGGAEDTLRMENALLEWHGRGATDGPRLWNAHPWVVLGTQILPGPV